MSGSNNNDNNNDLADALADVEAFTRRFVVMTDDEAVVVALWDFHTHAFEATDYTPYLYVTSAERESGKSRLKEVSGLLVARPISTSNVSPSALFRIAGDDPAPTFLVDEADEVFAPRSDRSELRGLLNAGFHRGDFAIRMVGEGSNMHPKKFSVYCPKLLAGKNNAALGDTLESRCIRIELKRKTRDEKVERFRQREVEEQADYLAENLRSLAGEYLASLAVAHPQLPEELTDRQQDVWEPLLAIADEAGGEWPSRARRAAINLSTNSNSKESLGVRLLADIRVVFEDEALHSAVICSRLKDLEEAPWAEWNGGKGLSPKGLADLLVRFGLKSKQMRVDGRNRNGYERQPFEDAWTRYLPEGPSASSPGVKPLQPLHPASPQGSRRVFESLHASGVEDEINSAIPDSMLHVEVVEDKPVLGGRGGDGRPVLGDEFYPLLLAEAAASGHITPNEFHARNSMHRFLRREPFSEEEQPRIIAALRGEVAHRDGLDRGQREDLRHARDRAARDRLLKDEAEQAERDTHLFDGEEEGT